MRNFCGVDRWALALIFGVLISIILFVLYNRIDQPYRSYQAAHAAEHNQDIRPVHFRTSDEEKAVRSADRDERRKDLDLNAQWQVVKWAGLGVIVGAVGTIAAIIGVVVIAQTLEATRVAAQAAQETIKITREIGEAQVQAYLSLKDGHGQSIANFTEAMYFNIENIGQSPALNLEVTRASACVTSLVGSDGEIATVIDEYDVFLPEKIPARSTREVSLFFYDPNRVLDTWWKDRHQGLWIEFELCFVNVFGRKQTELICVRGYADDNGSIRFPPG